jgi:non-specific serine/threonine protein kinase
MIGQTVSHYKILEKLGEGGMGVVYKAHDTKLDRDVALKFLPHHLTATADEQARFLQEARAASALNHANVCVIYDIQEHEGQQFIVMEYVDGKTLRQMVPVQKTQTAIDYAIQISEALQEAHSKAIVHRDVKTDNIMVNTKNQIKVMDFGLAKLKGAIRLTKTSSTVGTAAYMSPEQAQGLDVDHRTDIWSLGVVMFEMLTGKLPFRGEHEASLLYSIVHEEPQAVSSVRSDVPSDIVSVIHKTLQKDRSQRYQTLNEMVSDLKSATTTEPAKQEKSIIVLPFDDLSPDHDQEYFSDGLTEEIISDLSTVQALRVISRSSAMTFKGTKKKIPEIAREVNVHYVLEGSVRKAGNSLRITAQLIDAPTDAHLWAEKYSGTIDDVFDIQEKVARAIADALQVKLSLGEQQRLAERPIKNATAYEFYLRAMQLTYQWTAAAFSSALRNLESALRIEGSNPTLISAMAYTYYQHANMGFEPTETYRGLAKEWARKALVIDPESPLAHVTVGLLSAAENPSEGIRYFKRALQSDSNNVDALFWLICIAGSVKPGVERQYTERLLRLDPLHFMGSWGKGVTMWLVGSFQEAVEVLREGLLQGRQPVILWWLAMNLAQLGESDEAFELLSEIYNADPKNLQNRIGHSLGLAMKGQEEEAWRALRTDVEVSSTAHRDYWFSLYIAECHAVLEDINGALEWIERSVELGFVNYPFLNQHDRLLANVRGDERFKKLMERVRKEWEEFDA